MVTGRRVAGKRAVARKAFAAFNLSHGEVGLFSLALKPSEIFPFTRVSRVDEDQEAGFQRALDAHRVKRIAEYIKEGKVVPGAIILSAQDPERINFNADTGKLSFPAEEGFFLVIDGQHRLYGSVKAEADHGCQIRVPVCILTNLTHPEEVQYFIDINGNQKGVSKTLRIELTKFLVEEESSDAIRLRLFEDFNSDPESPLFGHLSATQRSVGYISHVPFKAALDRILDKDPLKKFDYDKKKKLLNNYLAGVADNLFEVDQGKRLYQSAFFQAIFRVFEKACEIALMYHRNYSENAFSQIFRFLQDLNFETHSGSNEDAIAMLAKEISLMLDVSLTTAKVSDDLL
ncbi:DGQHR domain-containing protein [Mitsuaria sp. BK045]|uniref:DGQHR domain-containing protein n=1 Tax=unclassified Roseateles TaxID=2626991 RepID=UPI0016218763|nr:MULTISPECIES: DGQHR domain-containing protein [unclassified Roseateles]MBB3292757.1 DGQHR domain-containing protein [Mitsuaria sp. BK041]MBB3361974.1 DGQHR domain-containing protein [Mitsuaria sp. BK045]